jgi:preprotein translocase subunit SecE
MADVKNWTDGAKEYFGELRNEMRRVTWPNRQQVQSTTGVVIFAVFAFAAYFEVVDTVMNTAVHRIITYFVAK